jgi:hypothetical protein
MDLCGSGERKMMGSYKHGDDPVVSIKCGKVIHYLKD